MARYHNEFKFNHPIHEQLFADIHQYMLSEGYEYRNFEGENVYKKGKGIAAGPTFIKIMADDGRIVVEAWVKFAVLPGVYAGESGLDSMAFGTIPKSVLADRVRNIERMITNNGGVATGATAPAPGAAPQPQQPPVQPQQPPQYAPPPVQPQAPVQPQPAPIEPQQVPVEPQPQQKREHIFCTRCGNKMPISASFCTSCGNKLK